MNNFLNVLLIDSDQNIHLVLEPILRHSGLCLFHAYSSNEGLEIIREHQSTINIVLLEIVLEPDGFTTINTIRKCIGYLEPVIAITGYKKRDIVNRIKENVMFNGYLPKPLDPLEIGMFLRHKIAEKRNPWNRTTQTPV